MTECIDIEKKLDFNIRMCVCYQIYQESQILFIKLLKFRWAVTILKERKKKLLNQH